MRHGGFTSLDGRIAFQQRAVAHHRYVCNRGRGKVRGWHCKALVWTRRELRQSKARRLQSTSFWIKRQIAAATVIGRESRGDPWPNCPDPFDGGGYTWWDTMRCENPVYGWLDGPGYYRCGLQFDPMWERRFGRLCP